MWLTAKAILLWLLLHILEAMYCEPALDPSGSEVVRIILSLCPLFLQNGKDDLPRGVLSHLCCYYFYVAAILCYVAYCWVFSLRILLLPILEVDVESISWPLRIRGCDDGFWAHVPCSLMKASMIPPWGFLSHYRYSIMDFKSQVLQPDLWLFWADGGWSLMRWFSSEVSDENFSSKFCFLLPLVLICDDPSDLHVLMTVATMLDLVLSLRMLLGFSELLFSIDGK